MKLTAQILILMLTFLAFTVPLWATDRIDVIRMKSGDVYRGIILKQQFEEFVQVELKDGNEKRLAWQDIQAIDAESAGPTRQISLEGNPQQAEFNLGQPGKEIVLPYDKKEINFDLDLYPVIYTTDWLKLAYQTNSSTNISTESQTNRRLYSLPADFLFRIYYGNWSLNTTIIGGSLGESGMVAPAYALSSNLHLGLAFLFQRDDLQSTGATDGNTLKLTSDYCFGPYVRFLFQTSPFNTIEIEGILGIDIADYWQKASAENTTATVGGSGSMIYFGARLSNVFSVSKNLGIFFGISGSGNSGSLNGQVISGASTVSGSLNVDNYSLAVTLLGLRLKL